MTTWPMKLDSRSPRAGAAFTLIELIAVMVIVAVLAGLTTLTLRSHIDRARLASACRLLRACDRHVRFDAAARQQPLVLELHSTRSMLRLPDGRRCSLGRGVRVDRLWTPHVASNRGTLRVVMSPTGQSDTYAVRLRCGKLSARWIMVLGTSGQSFELRDEGVVRELISVR